MGINPQTFWSYVQCPIHLGTCSHELCAPNGLLCTTPKIDDKDREDRWLEISWHCLLTDSLHTERLTTMLFVFCAPTTITMHSQGHHSRPNDVTFIWNRGLEGGGGGRGCRIRKCVTAYNFFLCEFPIFSTDVIPLINTSVYLMFIFSEPCFEEFNVIIDENWDHAKRATWEQQLPCDVNVS